MDSQRLPLVMAKACTAAGITGLTSLMICVATRSLDSCEAILTAACDARNSNLVDPARITSIATRHGAVTEHD